MLRLAGVTEVLPGKGELFRRQLQPSGDATTG
jgi:hypothetical protein